MSKLNIEKKGIIIIVISAILIVAIGTICFAMLTKNNNTVETISENDEQTQQNATEETNVADVEIIEEKEKDKKEDKKNNSISSDKYYVKVNVYANVVNVYTKDTSGNYTVPVKAMICSTGKATPVSGQYKLNGTKHRWHTLFGNLYGQYTTAIFGDILFHSVPYAINGDPSSLMYGYYDKLGTRASAGCIRLTVQDAIWIYNNITTGTIVEFYSSSNPGPFGKPAAQKISGNITYRGWDPTDPLPANPWKNYIGTTPSQVTPPQQPNPQPIQPTNPNEGNNLEESKNNTSSGNGNITDNTTSEGIVNETGNVIK